MLVPLIVALTQLALVAGAEPSPPTPVFASNIYIKGVLSLPYAELNEPFRSWYDKNGSRSRTDYYGDLYKIYQFGPESEPKQLAGQYGAMYKMVYVPASFHEHPEARGMLGKAASEVSDTFSFLKHASSRAEKSQVKRVCFASEGSIGFTIGPQSVLPNLADFTYDSTTLCPADNIYYRGDQCELWTYTNEVGAKRNVYKMWLRRIAETGEIVPVHYYMLGYDSLLGSHYDRYDISYHETNPNGATDEHFKLEVHGSQCGPMPGPGDDATEAAKRAHMIAQNPIHEYVEQPHRYDHVDHQFDQFKADHGKEYESEEAHRRGWRNYLHNLRFIHSKNRQLKDYKLQVNRFADNSAAELRYLRGRRPSKTAYNGGLDYERHHKLRGANQANLTKLPEQWDWTWRGAVTAVKDQAVCGSCWSFGTSGTLEGAYFVKTGKLPVLSQQQMVDCSWQFGNNGCDGGEDFRAYKYLLEAGGLATEDDYGHYLGVDGRCHDKSVRKTVKIAGFYNVTANDPEALKHALITYGPVTVAIDASRPTFTFYSHGVYYDDKCQRAPDSLDHQVLVTGYATIDGQFVWQVKNSWSTHWGNNGYILMSAKDNNCGLMDMPTVPIIKV